MLRRAAVAVPRRPTRCPSADGRAGAPLEELLARLGTSPEGLSTAEARRRFDLFGPNAPTTAKLRSKLVEFLRASANPLVVILLVASAASAVLGEVTNAAIIGGIVCLSAGINLWQTFRSGRAVRWLQERIAPTATVRRDGAWVELSRNQVVIGDVVRLSAGDLVPADARLIEASDLHAQQAALTGESLPAEKAAGAGALTSTGPDSPALVFLGTSIVSGTASALVFASGRDTAFGDVVERLAARPEETEFERGTRRFGMLILQTVVFLVLFILVVNVSLGRNALTSLLFSVALAVGLTPEFLPMITTATLAQGAIRMAREKVIVRHLASIQNLGSIDVLCSDKTGTLTAGTTAQITIPTDNVDAAWVRYPQRWDIGLIRKFMLVIGPVSSAYDFLTFFVLLHVFGFGETLFHTGWFLESLATQTLVLFVIRTMGRPWSNRPSVPLSVTTLLVVVIGAVLPFTPAAAPLGFAPLPSSYFLFLAFVVGTYLVLVDVVKVKLMERLLRGLARRQEVGP